MSDRTYHATHVANPADRFVVGVTMGHAQGHIPGGWCAR